MMVRRLVYYGLIISMICGETGCSTVEYVGQKKTYSFNASYLNILPATKDQEVTNATSPLSPVNSFYDKDRIALVTISKSTSDKSSSDFGRLYLHNGFSSEGNKDLVFQLSHDNIGYKATTPVFFNNEFASGDLVLRADHNRALSAGLQFSIKMDFFK